MARKQLLDAAAAKTCGNREDSFKMISKLWATYLGTRINEQDVCVMMILLKVARISLGFSVEDSLVDIAGYAACAAEYIDKPMSDPLSGAIAAYNLRNGIQPV